jgi:hypothetical protein
VPRAGLVEVGLSIEEAMMDGLKESCERMKREGRRVVVAQGDSDDVIHADVPRNILDVLGEEDCGVVEMEGVSGVGRVGGGGKGGEMSATAAWLTPPRTDANERRTEQADERACPNRPLPLPFLFRAHPTRAPQMGHAGSRGDPDKYIATAVARHANAFFNN